MTTTKPTISTVDVVHWHNEPNDVPADLSGVYWTDTDWTECRDHLLDRSWTVDHPSGTPTGVMLTGDVECDACGDEMVK